MEAVFAPGQGENRVSGAGAMVGVAEDVGNGEGPRRFVGNEAGFDPIRLADGEPSKAGEFPPRRAVVVEDPDAVTGPPAENVERALRKNL